MNAQTKNEKTILIVDDEPDLREIISLELEEAGFKVLEAENGKVAVETIKSKTVDAVITDINMPECNGFEFLKEVRKFDSPPHIFFLSGYAESKHQEANELEIQTIFTKPFDIGTLVHAVTKRLS